MANKYPNSGLLNRSREKFNDRSPDWWGKLEISGEVLAALNEGKQVKLSAWNRDGQYGEFISIAVAVDKPKANSEPARETVAGANDWVRAESKPSEPGVVEKYANAEFDDDIPF